MKLLKHILLLSLAMVARTWAADPNPPQTLAELQQGIEQVLRETGTPGAGIAIVANGRVEWSASLGYADVAAQKPASARTLFRLGSVSKEFIALAALKLQEEGRLKLTDTLRQWVPECPIDNPWEATDPIRLEQLLEHTAGVPEMSWREFAHSDPSPVSMAEALAFAPENRRVRWRPGSRQAYSNYGAQLAAAIVEKAAGERFEDYVRKNFFAPLGMTSAGYFLTPEVAQNLTRTYRPGGRQEVPYTHLVYRAAGAVSASVGDMANYVRFHLERGSLDGRRIVGPESIDRLEVPRTFPAAQAGVTTGQALFSDAGFVKGYEMHGHFGQVDGAQASFGYIPELGVGRVILINANDGRTMWRIRRLVDGYLLREVKERVLPAPSTVPAELRRELSGCYVNVAPHAERFFGGMAEYYQSLRLVTAGPEGMSWRGVLPGGPNERWLAMGDQLFRRPDATKPALGVVAGSPGRRWLQNDYGTWQKVPALRVWATLGAVVLSLLLVVSAALFALVWGLRGLTRRPAVSGPLAVRALPLVGAAGLVGLLWCNAKAAASGSATLGTLNGWTGGMFLMSLLLPAGALLGAAAVWRHRQTPMHRVVYWHAVAVTAALVFLTGFGANWGLVGVRVWS